MKKGLRLTLMAGIAAVLLVLGGYALMAQNEAAPPPPPGGQPGVGGPGGPGGMRFDPAQMQERMIERMKEQLAPTEDEWTVMKPLLGDVMKLNMNQMRGRFGGMMGRGGRRGQGGPGGPGGPGAPGGRGPGMPGMDVPPETAALQAAVDADNTPPAELKTKLAAFREAQKKNAEELKAAREKLRKVLTLRQEARLVLMGTLD